MNRKSAHWICPGKKDAGHFTYSEDKFRQHIKDCFFVAIKETFFQCRYNAHHLFSTEDLKSLHEDFCKDKTNLVYIAPIRGPVKNPFFDESKRQKFGKNVFGKSNKNGVKLEVPDLENDVFVNEIKIDRVEKLIDQNQQANYLTKVNLREELAITSKGNESLKIIHRTDTEQIETLQKIGTPTRRIFDLPEFSDKSSSAIKSENSMWYKPPRKKSTKPNKDKEADSNSPESVMISCFELNLIPEISQFENKLSPISLENDDNNLGSGSKAISHFDAQNLVELTQMTSFGGNEEMPQITLRLTSNSKILNCKFLVFENQSDLEINEVYDLKTHDLIFPTEEILKMCQKSHNKARLVFSGTEKMENEIGNSDDEVELILKDQELFCDIEPQKIRNYVQLEISKMKSKINAHFANDDLPFEDVNFRKKLLDFFDSEERFFDGHMGLPTSNTPTSENLSERVKVLKRGEDKKEFEFYTFFYEEILNFFVPKQAMNFYKRRVLKKHFELSNIRTGLELTLLENMETKIGQLRRSFVETQELYSENQDLQRENSDLLDKINDIKTISESNEIKNERLENILKIKKEELLENHRCLESRYFKEREMIVENMDVARMGLETITAKKIQAENEKSELKEKMAGKKDELEELRNEWEKLKEKPKMFLSEKRTALNLANFETKKGDEKMQLKIHESMLCCSCFVNQRTVVFLPCKCFIICHTCYSALIEAQYHNCLKCGRISRGYLVLDPEDMERIKMRAVKMNKPIMEIEEKIESKKEFKMSMKSAFVNNACFKSANLK